MLNGDTAAAVAFLKLFFPEGPWCLTRIDPTKKDLETRTFTKGDDAELFRWIDYHNGHSNIYFHVNEIIGNLTKKATREQIRRVPYLHVDVDPKKGADIEAEQQRILALLTTGLKSKGVPQPTFVIFSGGGYQAFWKLDEPIEVNGNIDLAEDAKLYNKQLEIIFGGDNCHNIDRIMRLPGTVNVPDAKKKAAGRVPVLARLIQHLDITYPLDKFHQAVLTQSDLKSHEKAFEISGNIERISDLNTLDEWSVKNRIKVIIAQGHDPDEPLKGDNSRSAWLWYALCEMARCEVPPDIMFALITDPDWGISASVLDKGRGSLDNAQRQIARAMQFAINPALIEMNDKHFTCLLGGKFRIAFEQPDPVTKKRQIIYMEKGHFKDFYRNDTVEVGKDKDGNPVRVPIADWWLGQDRSRNYAGVTFAPEAKAELKGWYNLWQGFAVDSAPGECDLFLTHCRENLCGGSDVLYKYLMGWIARMFQHPGRQGEVAVVLRGERGAGKSFFAHTLGKLLGKHYLAVANATHLVGNFNSHLRDLVLLFADEAFYAGDKKHESVLKTLITEPTLTIERKGVDLETSANCIHLIMASNDSHVIPVGRKERRFFILDVSDAKAQDKAYFKAMADQLAAGGYEALLHYFLNYDLSDFEVRDVPRTEELDKQMNYGLSPVEAWWKSVLEDGKMCGEDSWPDAVAREQVFEHYRDEMNANRARVMHRSALGMWLHEHVPNLGSLRRELIVRVDDGNGFYREVKKPRQYFYSIAPLQQCRDHWVSKYGPTDWGND